MQIFLLLSYYSLLAAQNQRYHIISEHSQFLNAKKRCRTAENDEEYCLGRGKCYENTDMCR